MHDLDHEISGSSSPQRALVSALRLRGVTERWVLAAIAAVPRELFGEVSFSSSYLVGLMTQALEIETGDSVLEIGTGSGYSSAVLSMLAGKVFTVERDPARVATARARLKSFGYGHIMVQCADGTSGWPEHAPYSRIVVRGAGSVVPAALQDQLAVGGRLVMPLMLFDDTQELVRITRRNDVDFRLEKLGAVRCTPLLGEADWPDRDRPPDTD
jgi:protein-L-isoaspartate(D-aspartate) O-methyltransferase